MPAVNDDFFRELEAERTRAIVGRDLTAIERLHAPEYELITPAGRVWPRARYIAAIAQEPFYASLKCGPIQVRRTPAMAIVRYTANISFPSGKVVDCWHTDSYELRGNVWQAVWSQATALPTPTTSQAGQ